MFASFPEYAELSDEGKGEITLRQMLTMTSGIPWDESYSFNDARNDLGHMVFFSPDPVRYVLEKRLTSRPGEMWVYNSGTTNLLGEILNRKTGTPLVEYARDNLFNPLGITSFEWLSFPTSPQMAVTSSLLYLKPRDMAKIGQLYLQQGNWNGIQIVSPQWVRGIDCHISAVTHRLRARIPEHRLWISMVAWEIHQWRYRYHLCRRIGWTIYLYHAGN